MSYVIKRGNRYQFRRRVPKEYQALHKKQIIQTPLKTDSLTIAEARALNFNKILEEYWADLARNGEDKDEARFKEAVRLARMSGFEYHSTKEIANNSSINEIINRLSIADSAPGTPVAAAVLGGTEKPEITISKARNIFFQHEQGNLTERSKDQIRKWENPRKRAIKNFITLSGDKQIKDVTREDILSFRNWWVERVRDGKSPNSANKEFSFIKQTIRTASDNYSLGINVDRLFKKIALKENTDNQRNPFSTEFITGTLLNRDLIKMNEECQLLLYAMADTGARVGELVGLDFNNGDIILDHEIPHIKIRKNDIRALKTPQSERDIPLVGASLIAFRELKIGFKHYLGKNDQISSVINKYLRENGLTPNKKHSLYSLRHSFEDRLTAVEPPDKVQAALMGHKYYRPKYGFGPSLEQKQYWLKKIALFE